jgi:hypothetical protein
VDLYDIALRDWPELKTELQEQLYGELEPIPVEVDDLGTVVSSKPAGPVATQLNWAVLDGEGFERLVYNLLLASDSYENPEWLTRTYAPDRGRDISVFRILEDELAGTTRLRIIVQCKHWLSKSINDTDLAAAVAQMSHHEPPAVDVLIVATSGRFTENAVGWSESRRHERMQPSLELWPESHLERLLAERPHIAAGLGLFQTPQSA